MSEARPKVVVVGAGLGGCLVSSRLSEFAEVTVIEQGPSDGLPLIDEDLPLRISPYAGSGLGGATRFWANGLIEPSERAFEHWPFGANVLEPWLDEAHSLLGGTSRGAVRADAKTVATFAEATGIAPSMFGQSLYYPARAQNVWESLGLSKRVEAVRGYVDEFNLDAASRVTSVGARTIEGRLKLKADIVILAAGGLGTPALLQLLPGQSDQSIAGQAGRHYDDHPSAFVAEFTGPEDLVRLSGEIGPTTGGNVRLPLVVDTAGCSCAFYVRPAAAYWLAQRYGRYRKARDRVVDRPWSPTSYLRLLARSTDAIGLAADRAGLPGGKPTRFNLFMIAGVPPSDLSYVWQKDILEPVHRRWHIDAEHIGELRLAVSTALAGLQGLIDDVAIYPDWDERLESAAHHSGTARLASSPAHGVCDTDCRVFDVPNLYVGDGALIPWSGFANTGLTIGALALRLADHLQETCR